MYVSIKKRGGGYLLIFLQKSFIGAISSSLVLSFIFVLFSDEN